MRIMLVPASLSLILLVVAGFAQRRRGRALAALTCAVATLVIVLALVNLAEARPARPREVKVMITLREQVAVRAWLEGVKADSNEKVRSLVAVGSDLRLDDARAWIEALSPEKAKALTIEKVPETKVAVSLDQGEAKDLVGWLAPTKERPQDRSLGAVLLGFSDAVEDALAARKP